MPLSLDRLPDLRHASSRSCTRRLPAVERLARQLAATCNGFRKRDLYKSPGVAETLDWAAALIALGAHELTAPLVEDTLGVVLKYQEDIARVREIGVGDLLDAAS